MFVRHGKVPAIRSLFGAVRVGFQVGHDKWVSDRLLGSDRAEFDRIFSKVDAIPGWLTRLHAAGLYRTMVVTRPQLIVEIGSYQGRSTALFALAARTLGLDARVVSVDPHTGDRQHLEELGGRELPSLEMFRLHLRTLGVDGMVEELVARSSDVAEGWDRSIDLLYVDGWHSFDAVVADGRGFLPHLAPDGIVVYDDVGTYPEVRAAHDALALQGLHVPWGRVGGQAYGGRQPAPPALQRMLAAARRTAR